MITTVLFDLGNVILPFDVTRLAARLAAYSPFPPHEIIGKLWNDEIADTFETGKMTAEEYFQFVSKECEFKGLAFEEFIPLFNEIFEEDRDIIDLIASLKTNYKLGLISNTNPIHVSYILSKYDHLNNFERHWFSNEAGYRKPHRAIFEMTLSHFEAEPSQAVFIDDTIINVSAAKELGIHSVHYKNADHLKGELKGLGVRF